MRLRIFSVVGEALHFGARRMETIMRVAWLPVVLILVLQMATVFAYLSVMGERLITFADFGTYAGAQKTLAKYLAVGLTTKPVPMLAVMFTSAVLELVLIASFMAPLVRLAGLGERPGPGVVKIAFGADQIRYIAASLLSILVMALFIFGPMAAAAFFTVKYILEAIAELRYAQFPNPESLHTINIVSARDVFFDAAALRPLSQWLPLAIAAPFAVGFWLVLTAHFHPKNRASGAGAPNTILRAIAVLLGAVAVGGLIWFVLLSLFGGVDPASGVGNILAIGALGALIVYYANLRIAPYVGVAVCRKSLSPGNTLRVTRGFNIFRLLAVFVLLALIIFAVQFLINLIAFPAIGATINNLFAATDVYTKYVNGGEGSEWVRPLFVWIWNGLKILANIFWAFFSYGVSAGILGRLYRESERTDDSVAAATVWRRG
ncbi:MAG: hypothetical protein RIE56_12810 [Amphiplicatus sp.]